jgi:hypothetical protein
MTLTDGDSSLVVYDKPHEKRFSNLKRTFSNGSQTDRVKIVTLFEQKDSSSEDSFREYDDDKLMLRDNRSSYIS